MVAALVLVLALAGCAGPSTEVMRTSGALAEGFEIEPGSALIGAVFPTPHPYGGGGRQAVLRVDGDARRVFDGYVRQAEGLGHSFEREHHPLEQWCNDREDIGFSDDDPHQPFPVLCTAYGSRGGDVELSLSGLVEPDGQGYVHLRTGLAADRPPLPVVPEGPRAPVTGVELAPELASTTDDPPVRLVEGSSLLLEPLGGCRGCGSYLALLRVTGELAPVLRGYEAQFASAGFTSSEGLIGDDDELTLGTETAGGGHLTAVAVAGDPSYVLIERVYD